MASYCVYKSLHSRLQAVLSPSNLMSLTSRQQRYMCAVFAEKNKKGSDEDPKRLPLRKAFKIAMKQLGPDLKMFAQEQKEKFTSSPRICLDHGNYEVLYKFNRQQEVDNWIVTADKDNLGGKSVANFTFSKNRTGIFHGHLCKQLPKDGKTKYTGYANISTPKPKKSFNRDTTWDWSLFNSLLLRVRGDGRSYMLVIGHDFYYDVNWLNRWTVPLFTRGGPYWQNVKIPLSKFYTSHSGRIQDRQEYVPLTSVNSFSITAGDTAEGPFYLEIDSIALMYDVNLSGKHAYELYENKYWEAQC